MELQRAAANVCIMRMRDIYLCRQTAKILTRVTLDYHKQHGYNGDLKTVKNASLDGVQSVLIVVCVLSSSLTCTKKLKKGTDAFV